ncbi:MAG: hypothetical protein EOO50_06555 [Flavobacterium sp.]|uniref:zinc-dependent peptidase n=1 Tax=Flavobacterium sp. TaxID=239 RepID=UPI001223B2F6|nr:zinc-dependent peptidase [Flavobacterium sp.]RZJ67179.1 MAG: hypothetical protein EOO50_06555 [Flavobacterium sp.]
MEDLSIPEIVVVSLVLFLVVFGFLSLVFSIFYLQTERVYAFIFKKPFYVHYYPFPKCLETANQSLLRQHSTFYNRLTPKRKIYFEHRICRFIDRYEFIGREDFEVTDEVKIRIAISYITLSFGMRNYLLDIFDRVIVYPGAYYSKYSESYHKGEFNPGMRAIAFSWQDFVAGNDIANDNLNLGIHEFAHVLHYHGTKHSDVSAAIFTQVYDRISDEVSHPGNRQRLTDAGYFRDYAFTNTYEFLAVILEHYFETPQEFKAKFPPLYANVSKMLNHKH